MACGGAYLKLAVTCFISLQGLFVAYGAVVGASRRTCRKSVFTVQHALNEGSFNAPMMMLGG